MINITVADDHPLMREGIKKVLNSEIDINILAEASDGKELLTILREELPDILILDITMPGKSGLDLLKDINNFFPELPVLILSIHPPERFALRALKAGARGYLCKSSITTELVKAVRTIVQQNLKYITPEVAQELAGNIDAKNLQNGLPHEQLSDREFEVLCLIANGLNVNTIADNLTLSTHTVHTYRSRIKEKLKLSSNVEMTRYALEHKLVN